MSKWKAAVMTALTVLVFGTPADLADVLVLKDGTRHEGNIVYNDADVVVMKSDKRVIAAAKQDVLQATISTPQLAVPQLVAPQPEAIGLEQAADRLAAMLKAQLDAAGAKAVAITPFIGSWWAPGHWGSFEDTVADALAKKLEAAGYRVIQPAVIFKLLSADHTSRAAAQDVCSAADICKRLAADAVLLGQVWRTAGTTVSVYLTLADGKTADATARVLGRSEATFDSNAQPATQPDPPPAAVAAAPEAAPPVAGPASRPAAPALPPGVVILRDGTKYQADLIHADADSVLIATKNEIIRLRRDDVIWPALGPQKPVMEYALPGPAPVNPPPPSLPATVPALAPVPVETRTLSAISTRFAPPFPMRSFFYRFVSPQPDAVLRGDRFTWTLGSGNTAIVKMDGTVVVTSRKDLAELNQAQALENDLAGILRNLGTMVKKYPSDQFHKNVELDSIYYSNRANVFYRFIVREHSDDIRAWPDWKLQTNGNRVLYGKLTLVMNGPQVRFSVGQSSVSSTGQWATRNLAGTDADHLLVKLAPTGWVRWYVAAIDLIATPGERPIKPQGRGRRVVEVSRTNKTLKELYDLVR